jgi:hypothetical protein
MLTMSKSMCKFSRAVSKWRLRRQRAQRVSLGITHLGCPAGRIFGPLVGLARKKWRFDGEGYAASENRQG